MTTIIKGKAIASWAEAVDTVLDEANVSPIPPEIVKCFTFIKNDYDKSDLKSRAINFIEKKLREEFAEMSETWDYTWWYVPVPRAKYIRMVQPHLSFTIDLYIAAPSEIHYLAMDGRYAGSYDRKYPCTVVGKFIKEAAQFIAPIALLKAIAEGDDSQYEISGKERYWTTWIVNAFEARLPDSFVQMIRGLKGKPLGKSLEAMKLVGTDVGPLMNKSSLSPPIVSESPVTSPGITPCDYDLVVTCLTEKMGLPKDKAEKATKYVIQKFPQAGLEEKIKEALIYLDGQDL